jgi:hypothetical protein
MQVDNSTDETKSNGTPKRTALHKPTHSGTPIIKNNVTAAKRNGSQRKIIRPPSKPIANESTNTNNSESNSVTSPNVDSATEIIAPGVNDVTQKPVITTIEIELASPVLEANIDPMLEDALDTPRLDLSPTVSPQTSPSSSPRTSPRTPSVRLRKTSFGDEQSEPSHKLYKRRSNSANERLVYGGESIPSISGFASPSIHRRSYTQPQPVITPTPDAELSEPEPMTEPTTHRRMRIRGRKSSTTMIEMFRKMFCANLCVENPLALFPDGIEHESVVPMTESEITEQGFTFGPDFSSLEEFLQSPNSRFELGFRNPLYNPEKAQDVDLEKYFVDEDTLTYNEIVVRLLELGRDPNDHLAFTEMSDQHRETTDKLSFQQRKVILERKQAGSALLKPTVALLTRGTLIGGMICEPVQQTIGYDTIFNIKTCSPSWKLQKRSLSILRQSVTVEDIPNIPNWRKQLGRRRSYITVMEQRTVHL